MSEKITNIESFLNQLPRLNEKLEGNFFYRGQSDFSFVLTPSVIRGNRIQKEHEIYSIIQTECAHEFDNTLSHSEVLSKMQHYGVPTRLLDITSNALVALYFACESNPSKDGVVYVIKINNENIKQYDSDSVTILASLPRFTLEEKNEIRLLALKYSDLDIKKFNKEPIIRRLLHEIKKEKPAFENIINPKDLLSYFYFIPRKTNPRIIRQSGAFIIFGLEPANLDIVDEFTGYNIDSYKIVIDAGKKQDIINQLSCFGITKASLHPELYKVAEYINEKYKYLGS